MEEKLDHFGGVCGPHQRLLETVQRPDPLRAWEGGRGPAVWPGQLSNKQQKRTLPILLHPLQDGFLFLGGKKSTDPPPLKMRKGGGKRGSVADEAQEILPASLQRMRELAESLKAR